MTTEPATPWRLVHDPAFSFPWSLTREGRPLLRADGAPKRYGRVSTAQHAADSMNNGATDLLADLIQGFRAANPDLATWERYPQVSDEQDAWTDTHACGYWSQRFAEYCRSCGVEATVMHGRDADEELTYEHYWNRVDGFNVDWTVRQFHNLEYPPNPRHQNMPCPMVWSGDRHPIVSYNHIAQEETS